MLKNGLDYPIEEEMVKGKVFWVWVRAGVDELWRNQGLNALPNGTKFAARHQRGSRCSEVWVTQIKVEL